MKTTADVVEALSALAQETRLALFRLLVEAGPAGMPAGAIAERLDVASPTLSFHLKELAHAGLVRASPQGRYVVYRADFDAMNALLGYLTENCCRLSGDPACAPVCAPKSPSGRRPNARSVPAASNRRRAS